MPSFAWGREDKIRFVVLVQSRQHDGVGAVELQIEGIHAVRQNALPFRQAQDSRAGMIRDRRKRRRLAAPAARCNAGPLLERRGKFRVAELRLDQQQGASPLQILQQAGLIFLADAVVVGHNHQVIGSDCRFRQLGHAIPFGPGKGFVVYEDSILRQQQRVVQQPA